MKNVYVLLVLCITGALPPSGALAQNDGFIYGKVTTIDGKSFEGPLRWGKEEVFWSDLFNSAKEENPNLKYLSDDQIDKLDERKMEWGNSWAKWMASKVVYKYDNDEDERDRHSHQFVSQFGEIKSLKSVGRSRVEVTLQDGRKVDVNGEGYNDIGSQVKVIDSEIGEVSVDWNRIEKVEFSSFKGSDKFGEPLFGTVETYAGTFTGYVQWDHDERVDTDKLDGDTEDGDVSISFENIVSIERDGSDGSRIELKSGRKMHLRGSNDVNGENRGVIVTTADRGRVDIPWKEFKSVKFSKASFSLKAYKDYGSTKELKGEVKTTDGKSYKGKIIYDLDEEYSYEMLQGKEDNVEYFIPFGDIKKITPKNYDYSKVVLKSGKEMLLEDGQDISDKNSGILVFANSGDPQYILWEDIEEISFN